MIKVQEIFINIKIDTAIFFNRDQIQDWNLICFRNMYFFQLDIFRENMHNKGITDKLGCMAGIFEYGFSEVVRN